MKVGLSTYSLNNAREAGEMSVLDIVQWVADNGGEHIEIATYGLPLIDDLPLADAFKAKAASLGIELSNYCTEADLIQETEEAFEAEIARIKRHIDFVHDMGIRKMRCDVTSFELSPVHTSFAYFDANLPRIVQGCQTLADYAANYGITLCVENHGYCIQASDRVQRVLSAVNRANFKTVLDVGNFLCVDEDPLNGVRNNLPYAAAVHFKDFYYRPAYRHSGGEGWFDTSNGNRLRGAIVGDGDLPIREIVRLIKQSGYDGHLTIEFEGLENCRYGSRAGMDNVRRFWNEA